MKILYAVQATGNGHISRAKEILPYLREFGETDIMLSGMNHDLSLGEFDSQVRYRSPGLSLYYNEAGALHTGKTLAHIYPGRLTRNILSLPVHRYDAVLNDFDFVTSRACAWRNIPSVNFGHHASFRSDKTPRPERQSPFGEFILKNFGLASGYLGLHFESYDDFIHSPVIKKKILEADPVDRGHITVYLPSCSAAFLRNKLAALKDLCFEIFSKEIKTKHSLGNCTLYPAGDPYFTESMIGCSAIISGSGFETPAEALHLGKKMMVSPIRGQYEQECNAAALKRKGIRVLHRIGENFSAEVADWFANAAPVKENYRNHIPELLEYIFDTYPYRKNRPALISSPKAG